MTFFVTEKGAKFENGFHKGKILKRWLRDVVRTTETNLSKNADVTKSKLARVQVVGSYSTMHLNFSGPALLWTLCIFPEKC